MEPKIPNPESAPAQPPRFPEYQPDAEQSIARPEYSPERSNETKVGPNPSAPPQPFQPVITLPTPVPIQPPADNSTVLTDDTPQVAADEDLIEKEWVDKAKKVISETKDDPHAREREVGRLQVDYLRKRYGKELGESK